MSWSESSPPVKVPDKDRQRPADAVNRTPGPPRPGARESRRGWYFRVGFYLFVLAVLAGAVVWISLAGI